MALEQHGEVKVISGSKPAGYAIAPDAKVTISIYIEPIASTHKNPPFFYGVTMLSSGIPQYHPTRTIAPMLMLNAMRKLTSLLSKRSQPFSTTRLGLSSP